jgi:TolA-binding protein
MPSWPSPVLLLLIATGVFLASPPLPSADASRRSPAPMAAADDAGDAGGREARLLFNTGSRLYRQKSWSEAARAFGDFLDRFPRHPDAPEARFARGYSLSRLGRHVEAYEDFRRALEKEDAPWAPEAAFYLGRSLEAIVEKAPADEAPKLLLAAAEGFGRAARLYGSRKEAAGPDSEGEEKGKESPPATREDLVALSLVARGEALHRAGSHAEAARDLESLSADARFRKSPSFARGLYVLALAHQAASEKAAGPARDAEIAAARKALETLAAPEFEKDAVTEEGLFLLARILHRSGDRRGAAERYVAVARRKGPRAAEASFSRAVALYETGSPADLAEAGAEIRRFLEAQPRHDLAPRARLYEALILFDGKRYREAVPRLRAAASEGGDLSGLASLRLGQALILGDPSDPRAAAEALGRAVKAFDRPGSEGDRAEALYWQGEALISLGEKDAIEAARLFGEAARAPAAAATIAEKGLYQQARALFIAGKRAECSKAARDYRERYPGGKGRFFLDSLKLSAENACRARSGEPPDEERKAAPRYYREAAEATEDPSEARRLLYLSGIASHGAGDFAAAAAVLEKVREDSRTEPLQGFDEPDLPFFLADALIQISAPASPEAAAGREGRERAASLLEEYLSKRPGGANAPIALANLGFCRVWLDDQAAAAKAFSAYLKSHADHALAPRVRAELAGALLRTGDADGALREYRAAAASLADPAASARAALQAASLEMRAGRPASAVDLLEGIRKKLEAGPTSSADAKKLIDEMRFQAASGLAAAGKAAEARKAFESLLAASPTGPRAVDARLGLARLILDGGGARKALEAIEPLLAATPGSDGRARALYLRAWCFRALADGVGGGAKAEPLLAETEASYGKLIEEEGGSDLIPDVRVELGQMLFNRKDHAEAGKLFEAARAALEADADPEGGRAAGTDAGRRAELLDRALFGLAFVSSEAKDHARARALFDRVAGGGTADLVQRALFQAGRAWMLSGDDREAAARFRKLLEIQAERSGALREEAGLRLGECLNRLGDPAGARKAIEAMLAEFPAGKLRHEGLFVVGFAHRSSGDLAAAVRAFREVTAGTDAAVAARAQYHIGECLADEGKNREAAREFLAVAANFDFDGPYREWVRRALLAAGIAYETAGENDAAQAQYEELAKRFPDTDEGRAAAKRLAGQPK